MAAAETKPGSAAKLRAMGHAMHGCAARNLQALIVAEIIGISNMLTKEAAAWTRAHAPLSGQRSLPRSRPGAIRTG